MIGDRLDLSMEKSAPFLHLGNQNFGDRKLSAPCFCEGEKHCGYHHQVEALAETDRLADGIATPSMTRGEPDDANWRDKYEEMEVLRSASRLLVPLAATRRV
jgi:hypothetical protein